MPARADARMHEAAGDDRCAVGSLLGDGMPPQHGAVGRRESVDDARLRTQQLARSVSTLGHTPALAAGFTAQALNGAGEVRAPVLLGEESASPAN